MAIVLDTQEMLANDYEPKRKFRWIMSISGIDAFTLKTAQRPQIVFDETIIDYQNVKRYVAGKPTWSPLNITLYDPIVPSAAQKTMEWIRTCFENTSGRMGYATMYQKDVNLRLLDPVGAVVEDWLLQRTWVQDANYNDLDFTVSDPVDISLVLRFDQAVLLY